jgi:ankyrin repeat protein
MGHYDVVKLLVSRGARVDVCDKFDKTPLAEAVLEGRTDIAELLLSRWPASGVRYVVRWALYVAAGDGRAEMVNLFFNRAKKMAPPLGKETLYIEPLGIAAHEGHENIVRFFLSAGADVNATDSFGRTVLHLAAQGGHVGIVRLLIDKGAKVEVSDNANETPLTCGLRSKEVTALLIASGANVQPRSSEGETPFHYVPCSGEFFACKAGLELLLAHGADINALDCEGETPLSRAEKRAAGEEPYSLTKAYLTADEIKDVRAGIEFIKAHGGRSPLPAEKTGDGRFNGGWRSPDGKHTLWIDGREGRTARFKRADILGDLLAGSDVPELVLRICSFHNDRFTAMKKHADGGWFYVEGVLKAGVLHIEGNAHASSMTRIAD